MLVWSLEKSSREGNNIFRPWLGLYRVDEVLSPVSFIQKSELRGKIACVHPNRMQNISAAAIQISNARNGVFLDGIRLLERMNDSKGSRRNTHWEREKAGQTSHRWSEVPKMKQRREFTYCHCATVRSVYRRSSAHCRGIDR